LDEKGAEWIVMKIIVKRGLSPLGEERPLLPTFVNFRLMGEAGRMRKVDMRWSAAGGSAHDTMNCALR
jgi:hypothetical protein